MWENYSAQYPWGLDRLSSGKMFLKDQEISQYSDTQIEKFRREKVGFVFQFLNLIPELTAEENIILPLDLMASLTDKKREHIDYLLNLIGLHDRKDHRPDELSGGEQQRIGVAAALANDPEIILCDEPTGELDSQSKQNIMNLLRKVIEEYPSKVMIIVTHDPELKMIADRMYYIRDGVISHQFNSEELAKFKQNDSGATNSSQGQDSVKVNEQTLIELREIEYIINQKIQKIEKEIHPI
jgi:putative ABC transport system ATP-binding protein